jgi:hypothetical protein
MIKKFKHLYKCNSEECTECEAFVKMSRETFFWIGKVKNVWIVRCKITKVDMHIKVQVLRWQLPNNGQNLSISYATYENS